MTFTLQHHAIPTPSPALTHRPYLWAVVVGILAFAVYHASFPEPTPFNQYVRLADAITQGRVYLVDPPSYLEITTFRGRHFVIPPPFPALLLLPYVALLGPDASQSLASHLVGALAAALTFLLAARLAPRQADHLWLGLMGAFGTILWFLSAVGSTWYFAHVVAVTALTLGVLETVDRRHPILIGLAVAIAYWTRLPTILTLPYFLLATSPRWAPGGFRAWRRIDLGYLIRLAAPIAVALLLNSLYNWMRFGTTADVANVLRPGILDEPWFSRGLFHSSYIVRHLRILFAELPVFIPHPPYLLVPWTGLAIWVTTPAFIYALRAPAKLETLAAWLGIGSVAIVVFSYGYTGKTQFGYRFATDFYPLLFLLMVRGMRGRVALPAKVLIILGVLVNTWGVLWTRWGWVAP